MAGPLDDNTAAPLTAVTPLVPASSLAHIEAHLREVQRLQIESASSANVFHLLPHCHGWKDDAEKANNVDYCLDLEKLKTFSQFSTAGLAPPVDGRTRTRVGLFITWPGTWVGKHNRDWAEMEMHAWVAVVIPGKPQGRALVIWDPNASDQLAESKAASGRRKDVLLGRQLALVKYLEEREHWSLSRGVWYGGGEGGNPMGKCLSLSVDWIREDLLPMGKLEVEDLPGLGFTHLKK